MSSEVLGVIELTRPQVAGRFVRGSIGSWDRLAKQDIKGDYNVCLVGGID